MRAAFLMHQDTKALISLAHCLASQRWLTDLAIPLQSGWDIMSENALEQKQPEWGHRDTILPPGLPLCTHETHRETILSLNTHLLQGLIYHRSKSAAAPVNTRPEVRLGTQKAITTAERDFSAKIAAQQLHLQSIPCIMLLERVCSISSP